jgi:hypothetical protein
MALMVSTSLASPESTSGDPRRRRPTLGSIADAFSPFRNTFASPSRYDHCWRHVRAAAVK